MDIFDDLLFCLPQMAISAPAIHQYFNWSVEGEKEKRSHNQEVACKLLPLILHCIFTYNEEKYPFLWETVSYSLHATLLELSLTIFHHNLPRKFSLIQARPVIFSLPGIWKLNRDPSGLKTLELGHPLSGISKVSCVPLLPSHLQAWLFLWGFPLILWAP